MINACRAPTTLPRVMELGPFHYYVDAPSLPTVTLTSLPNRERTIGMRLKGRAASITGCSSTSCLDINYDPATRLANRSIAAHQVPITSWPLNTCFDALPLFQSRQRFQASQQLLHLASIAPLNAHIDGWDCGHGYRNIHDANDLLLFSTPH